jgi:hypothetical protein
MHGRRLNPRKVDLHRWRETFADKLRGYGIDAEATRQAVRGQSRSPDALWRLKARDDGRLKKARPMNKAGAQARASRADALGAWVQIGEALARTGDAKDVQLASSIAAFIQEQSATWELPKADRDSERNIPPSVQGVGPTLRR